MLPHDILNGIGGGYEMAAPPRVPDRSKATESAPGQNAKINWLIMHRRVARLAAILARGWQANTKESWDTVTVAGGIANQSAPDFHQFAPRREPICSFERGWNL